MELLPRRPQGRWRLLRTSPTAGARNMAVDEALLESVRQGGPPTLRLYGWTPPCLSFGRNQPALGHYPLTELRALGIDVVRRSTGGRAVLHDGELTYSIVLPDRVLGTAKRAYTIINDVLVAALAALGVDACVLQEAEGPASIPSTVPCFADPAPGEVLVAGRKLIGSAQIRVEGVLLQHGSILLRRSPLIDALARRGLEIEGRPAYLENLVGGPADSESLTGAIVAAWKAGVGPLDEAVLTAAELARVEPHTERFTDDGWTWRR